VRETGRLPDDSGDGTSTFALVGRCIWNCSKMSNGCGLCRSSIL